MGLQWKRLWILVTLLYFVANVQAQSDEGKDEWSDDDYEDWPDDRFDDIFKSSDSVDDYQELLKKINDAKDREIYEKLPLNEEVNDKDDTILNKSDPELQVEDVRFLDIPDENINEEVVGDENLNGNAPINDYDPDEYEEEANDNENSESESIQQHDEPENLRKSPYAQPKRGPFSSMENNESEDLSMVNYEPVKSDSLEEELKKIFKETQDILKNDDESNNFSDLVADDKKENIPEQILEETQDILNEDSNDISEPDAEEDIEESESYDPLDMNYEDLNEDLKALLDTLDKLENDDKTNDSNEALEKEAAKNNDDDLNNNNKNDENHDSASDFDDIWRNDLSSDKSPESNNAESEDANDEVDSSEKDRQALADLNAWIEQQIKSSLDDDSDDDYKDFYDDDDKDDESKIENVAPIPYGNDAFDPNEPIDGKIEEVDAKSLNEEEDSNDFKDDSRIVKNDVQDDNDFIDDQDDEKEYSTKKKLTGLSSDELDDKIEEFRIDNENVIALELELDENITPTDRIISLDKAIVERSPNYPEAYDGPIVLEWFYHGEGGSGIELNITDLSVNGGGGDYLLFKPGRANAEGTDGLIFSYMLRHERRYRFFDVDTMFVKFVARNANFQNFKGFEFSVKFIAPKVVRNTEPEPIPEPVAQRPAETLTVHLLGITHHEYRNISENFRLIVADMAAMYIHRFGIDPGILPLNEVTQITMVTACNIAWPYHDTCSSVTFGIPLYYNDTDKPDRLTRANLTEMWLMFARIDPFDTRLAEQGIMEYDVPNERAIVSVWWLASFVIMLFALSVGFGLWRFNCFQDYNGMKRLHEDTDSIGSARKSDLSLYPTPHQNLPPMFSDGQYDHYLDGDYDYDANEDTTRVDMGGAFDNRNFFRDGELMDLGSDEEIIMSLPDDGNTSNRQSYSSGIRPRDVYEV